MNFFSPFYSKNPPPLVTCVIENGSAKHKSKHNISIQPFHLQSTVLAFGQSYFASAELASELWLASTLACTAPEIHACHYERT